jgi:hypothetical protein
MLANKTRAIGRLIPAEVTEPNRVVIGDEWLTPGDCELLVGNSLETIELYDGTLMVLNRNAAKLGLPVNGRATVLAFAGTLFGADCIRGPALLIP